MKYIIASFMLMLWGNIQAQQLSGSIKGKVITSDGEPAEFVNIGIKGVSKGAAADKNGNFDIRNIEPGTYTLVASFTGLLTQEKEIQVKQGEISFANFTLQESAQQLQEVVVFSKVNAFKADNISPTLRLQTPLIETPQNIQVVTSTLLSEQQVFDMLEGVTRNVSGVSRVEHWDNYARINMRGSQIAAFRNGMNVQMPWGPLTEDMSMVERIEFVKGPAGFMMANGEPSGFYNLVTKKPTGINRGETSFTLGSFQTYRATLDLDGKLSSDGKLLYRLNMMGQQRGSHRDYENNNRYTIAPVIKYIINENTSLTAEYTYQYSQMSAIGSNYSFSNKGYADLPLNFTTAEPNLSPTDINDHSVFITLNHHINDNWKVTGQLAYLKYKQIGSSLWPAGWPSAIDEHGNLNRGISIWDALGESKQGQFFVNGNIKTGAFQHHVLGGVDMYHKDYFADWMQSFTIEGAEPFNIYNPVYGKIPASALPEFDRSRSLKNRGVLYNTTSVGLYVQDEIHFWQDRLRLTLAARHTSAQTANPYAGITNDSQLTPRVGFSASINPNTNVYALYDQAFLPQAGAAKDGKAFDPITGNNIELGIKRDWFDGKWNTTVSAYKITKNNVLTADPENPNFSIQLGQTQAQGLEFDLRGDIAKGLNVILNYALTESKISKDTDASLLGKALPGTSKHIHNGWLSYKIPTHVLKGLGVSMGYQWQLQRSSWFVFDGSENALPDYFRLDGALSWQNEKLRFALNFNNLLNQYLFSGAPYGDMYYWQTEPGRNARMTVAYKF